MRRMLFENNTHGEGINLTVRRGRKWSDLRAQEKIILAPAKPRYDSVEHPAKVAAVLVMPFFDIPASLLQHGHDESCRTKEGLLAEMQRVYEGFMGTEEVTLVLYYVK